MCRFLVFRLEDKPEVKRDEDAEDWMIRLSDLGDDGSEEDGVSGEVEVSVVGGLC